MYTVRVKHGLLFRSLVPVTVMAEDHVHSFRAEKMHKTSKYVPLLFVVFSSIVSHADAILADVHVTSIQNIHSGKKLQENVFGVRYCLFLIED